MPSSKTGQDRLLLGIIITISVAGILFFGIRAVYENIGGDRENPFEYDIEHFKKSGADRIAYSEVDRLEIEMEHPYGIAVGVDDTIYVSGEDSVLILNKEGQPQATIATGETANFTATGLLSNNATVDITENVIWSSSQPEVATVSNDIGEEGVATGISAGSTLVRATSGGLESSLSLTVN